MMEKFIVGKFNTESEEGVFEQIGDEGEDFLDVCLRARDLQSEELKTHVSYYGLHIIEENGRLKIERGLRYQSPCFQSARIAESRC